MMKRIIYLIKLHLGCGKRYIPGFIHIDLVDYEHIDYQADIRHLDMFESNTVDLIYASHILEHFGRWEYEEVLKEWYRVLKKGGILRLSVPDFNAYLGLYREGWQLDRLFSCFCGGQYTELDYHHMVFNEEFLTRILITSIGFKKAYRWNWRNTEHSDIDDFSQSYHPHMDKIHGRLMSLNMEAEK